MLLANDSHYQGSFGTSTLYVHVGRTIDRSGGNGKIFVGAAFPAQVKEAKTALLPEKEKKERGGADGHILAISEYEPCSEYTYYWGSAWDKAAIKTVDAWNTYG